MRFANLLCIPAVLAPVWSATNQESKPEEPPTLVVSGEARVSADPDRAVLVLGTRVQASQADAAQQQVNQAMQAATSSIREVGVADEAMQTTGLSLHPVYSGEQARRPGDEPTRRLVGYRASNSLRIRLSDLSQVGRVIDAGIAAGANQLEGIQFELADDTQQRAEALRSAVERARTKAEALAQATGVRLTGLHRIEEGGVQTRGHEMPMRAMAMDSSTPVQPGQVEVSASVTLVYRFENASGADEER